MTDSHKLFMIPSVWPQYCWFLSKNMMVLQQIKDKAKTFF